MSIFSVCAGVRMKVGVLVGKVRDKIRYFRNLCVLLFPNLLPYRKRKVNFYSGWSCLYPLYHIA